VPDVALRLRAGDRLESKAAPPGPGQEGRMAELRGRAGREGVKVRIEAGEIPVQDVARFLSDYTGLPVVFDSSDKAMLDEKIIVPAPIPEADYELAKALLEAGGLRLSDRELASGQRLLLLESKAADAKAEEPVPRPLVIVGDAAGRHATAAPAAKGAGEAPSWTWGASPGSCSRPCPSRSAPRPP
jgi:hypothetical protein